MEKKIIALITTFSLLGTFVLVGSGALLTHSKFFQKSPPSYSSSNNTAKSNSYYDFLHTNSFFRKHFNTNPPKYNSTPPKNNSTPPKNNSPPFTRPFIKQCFIDDFGFNDSDAAILSDPHVLQKILGIPSNSDLPSIKTAIRKFALKYHSDKNPDAPRALQDFISVANNIFSDPSNKSFYNSQGVSCKSKDVSTILDSYKALFNTK